MWWSLHYDFTIYSFRINIFYFVLCWFYENHKFDWFHEGEFIHVYSDCAFWFWFICWLMLTSGTMSFHQESEPTTRSEPWKTLVRFLVERDVKFPVSPRLIGHMSQPKPKESQVEIETQQFRWLLGIGNTHEVEQFLTWFTFSTAIFLEKEVLNLGTIIFKF